MYKLLPLCTVSAGILLLPAARSDYLLVGDLHGDRVLTYDASTGASLGVFADTHMDGPQAIVRDAVGNVYVGSEYSGNITKWSPTGTYLGEFVSPGTGGMGGVQDMEFGPDGHLYVTCHVPLVPDSVWKFDGTTGAFLGMHGLGGGFAHTHGMSWRPADGNLYQGFLAGPGSLVRRFHGAGGAMLSTFAASDTLAIANDLLWGPDDDLYASNPLVDGFAIAGVTRFDGATGAYLGVFSDVGFGGSWGMAFRDGFLYYTAGGAVVRVDSGIGGAASVFVAPGAGGLSVGTAIMFTTVPEPGSGVVLIVGSGLLLSWRRRCSLPKRHAA